MPARAELSTSSSWWPWTRVAPLIAFAASITGCDAAEKERPPLQNGGSSCVSGCSGRAPSREGAGGQGGGTGTEVSGVVVTYDDDAFLTTTQFPEDALVRGEPAAQLEWAEAPYDGTSFSLPEVRKGGAVWFAAQANDAARYWPTLALQDTTQEAIVVPLVSNGVIEDIFASSLTGVPSTAAAQVVIQILDTTGAGIGGVRVQIVGAEFVAYADQTSWISSLDRTTASGLAFVGNLPASDFPGQIVTITLTGTVQRALPARIAQGAVTVLRVSAEL